MRIRASVLLPGVVVLLALGMGAFIWPRWVTPLLVVMPVIVSVSLLSAFYLDRTHAMPASTRGAATRSGLRSRWKLRLALILVGLSVVAVMVVLILTQAQDVVPVFVTSSIAGAAAVVMTSAMLRRRWRRRAAGR